jgi:hypothetical protein
MTRSTMMAQSSKKFRTCAKNARTPAAPVGVHLAVGETSECVDGLVGAGVARVVVANGVVQDLGCGISCYHATAGEPEYVCCASWVSDWVTFRAANEHPIRRTRGYYRC